MREGFWFRVHTLPHWAIQIAHEAAGKPIPLDTVTGRVKTRTKWGARRVLRKVYGPLSEIEYVGRERPA